MYPDIDAARSALSDAFPADALDALVAALRPAIVFLPVEGETAHGATRIGGEPDLPFTIEWPIRPTPPDIDAIAERGGSAHRAHIRKHLELAMPYQFVAQVDLAEAARLGDIAAQLPATGRLLFFCDMAVLPWRNGTESCRVIWDQTPIAQVARAARPDALEQIGAESQREWRAICAEHGWPAPPDDQCSYWGPSRLMRLAMWYGLPDRSSLEAQGDASLQELLQDDEVEDAYLDLSDQRWATAPDVARRQQLLGSPLCEQDDPRYDAVVSQMTGGGFLSSAEWKKAWPSIEKGASDWLLLFQLDQSDYLQQSLTEGTVYFLIRRDDLELRAFDKVVAVYQQT